MDRLSRTLAGCGLALLSTTAGCHNVREEVPPHHKFRNDGRADAPVEFSTKPHEPPASALGAVGGSPANTGPSGSGLSSTSSPGNAYGNLNSGNKFAGPGSSGLGEPPPMSAPGARSAYPPQPAPRAEEPGIIAGQPADAPSPF